MHSLFVLVSNDAEAQAYIAQPNQTVYLLNLKEGILTIKKADKEGLYEPEKYYLSKDKKDMASSDVEYVSMEQFTSLQNQINSIFQILNNKNSNPQPKNGGNK